MIVTAGRQAMTLLSDTQAKLIGPTRICRQLTATTVCSVTTAHLSKCTKQQQRTGCCQPYKASMPHSLCMAKQAAARLTQCVLWYKQQRKTYFITSGTLQVQSSNLLPDQQAARAAHRSTDNNTCSAHMPICVTLCLPCRQRIYLADVSN